VKRIAPGVALLLTAPVIFNPVVFAALALPYGCGALLCRE
jgi:hypothetical protein